MLGAEVLQQMTLRVGPLSISQPLLVVVNPIVSIALSVWIFEEYFTTDVLRIAVGSAAFAAMCVCVVVLTERCRTRCLPRAVRGPIRRYSCPRNL